MCQSATHSTSAHSMSALSGTTQCRRRVQTHSVIYSPLPPISNPSLHLSTDLFQQVVSLSPTWNSCQILQWSLPKMRSILHYKSSTCASSPSSMHIFLTKIQNHQERADHRGPCPCPTVKTTRVAGTVCCD